MDKVVELILNHVEQRPCAQPRDIYKLLYQGVFGVGHIVGERAWDILVEEAGRIRLDEHLDDPLLENCSPSGDMVRVNLRQYINAGYDLQELYEAVKKSSQHKGDEKLFMNHWNVFRSLVMEGRLPYDIGELDAIEDVMRREGVKPMHHTESYREAYYPAYRVVERRFLPF